MRKVMFKQKKDKDRQKERNINPDLPAKLMEDSCLLMDDILSLVSCLHKL